MTSEESIQYDYIDTADGLARLCQQLVGSAWLALDTEFMREKTYYSRFCLLQLANEDIIAIIDPLAFDNLDPLFDVIYNPSITKIFHSGVQDLQIFYQLRTELPEPVFDTQIAASVLGDKDQIGYALLVKTMMNITLHKTHTRTDWSQRPLSPAQLDYAADDVRYLGQVYLKQVELLDDMNRLTWLDDDFASLVNKDRYINDPESMWKKIRGAKKLKGKQLAVLRSLAAWRENTAINTNKPRRWICNDDVLSTMGRIMPDTIDALEQIRGVTPAMLKNSGDEILDIIHEATTLPESQWPVMEQSALLTPDQDAIADAMMAIVRIRSQQYNVSPASLTTRKEIERVLTGDTEANVLHGWRGKIVGNELRTFLNGSSSLCVKGKSLDIVSVE